jgi:PAS domain S-box-containing protein
MSTKGTILAVDDHPESLALLVNILGGAGYEVRPADSGELALAAVAAHPPDLILLDMRLPGLGGLEVCRQLKARAETRLIPVILFSGHAEVPEWVAGLRLGAVDYIVKPIQPELLLARVEVHLSLGQSRAALLRQEASLRQANAQLQAEVNERKRMEVSLRESNARFNAIALHTPDHILMQDCDLRYLFVINPQLGLTQADMIGRTDHDFLAREDADRLTSIKRKVLATGQPQQVETSLLNQQGQTEYFDGAYIPNFDQAGQIDGLVGYFHNTTEHRRGVEALAQSKHRLELAYRSAAAAPWDWDMTAQRLDWSPELFAMFGLDSGGAEANFETWERVIHPEDRKPAADQIEQAIKTRAPLNNEYRVIHPNGQIRWITALGDTTYDPSGHPVRMTGICIDITDRKQVEMALAKSEEIFSKSFRACPEAMAINSLENGHYVEVNDCFLRTLGFAREQVIGHTSLELGVWVDLAQRQQFVNTLRQNGCLRNFEAQYRVRSGAVRDFLVSSETIVLEGTPCSLNFMTDITERKRAEDELRQNELIHRTILQTTLDGFWLLDLQGRILEVNDAYCQMSGFSHAELLQRSIPDLEADQSAADIATNLAIIRQSKGARFERRHRCRDGRLINVEISVSYLATSGGRLFCFIRDITERLRIEQNYRMLFQEMLDGFALHELICDQQGNPRDYRFLALNPAFERMTGLKAEAIVGRTVLEVMPGTEPHWIETYGRVALTGIPVYFQNYSADLGKHFQVSAFRPAPNQFVCVFIDITEQKKAEAAKEEALHRLQKIASRIPGSVYKFRLRPDGTACFPYVSDGFHNLFQLRPEEVREDASNAFARAHPDDYADLIASIRQSAQNLTPWVHEFRTKFPDGTVRWFSGSSLPEREADGSTIWHGFISDATERKALEEQLRQAQKLESIGQLAGGVAHDFNNILAALMMNFSLLQQDPHLDPETQETLEQLMTEATRAATLTRQLLMFSRRSVMAMKVLDLNGLLTNLLKMLGRLIGEHITVCFERCESLPMVEADAGMLEQVIMNLAVNARDAMPKGGLLTFKFGSLQVGPERIQGNPEVQPGLFVCLSVADTGCGMDEATLKHIFEPFFTTKQVGQGTGLGLATAYGIVAQHRGWMEVESQLGQGATFKVFLPATHRATGGPVQEAISVPLSGRETILLVEDESSVRQMVARGLRRLGYQVLEAAHGQAALAVWQEHAGQIDLLFSDMIMPGDLTGLDLAGQLRAQKPGLKVILTSGYSAEVSGAGLPANAGVVFLQKPFHIRELSQTVRNCLDSSHEH